jgi:predicted TIM-barrel fold metal-dependent hydrolase
MYLGLTPSQVPRWWMDEMYRPFGGGGVSRGGKETVEMLDDAGIDVGIVQGADIRRTTSHPDHPGDHNVFIPNEWVAEEIAKFPGRLLGQVTVDPLRDPQDALAETERLITEHGFVSLGLKTAYHNHAINDRRVYPFYEKCIELDVPVHVFTGWTPIINAPMRQSDPILLDDVGREFRDLRVVFYVSFPWVDEGIAVLARHPNFYIDLSHLGGGSPEALYDVLLKIKDFGAIDRAVYGSDGNDKIRIGKTAATVPELYRQVNDVAARRGTAEITDQEMAAIMGGTAGRVYKLDL